MNQTLTRMCTNPLGDQMERTRAMAAEAYDVFVQGGANTTRATVRLRDELLALYRQVKALREKATTDQENTSLDDLVTGIENYHCKACSATNFTYVPMDKLDELQAA